MKRSKIIFLILAAVFFLAMVYVVYDLSTRTTFPGADRNKQVEENVGDTLSDPE